MRALRGNGLTERCRLREVDFGATEAGEDDAGMSLRPFGKGGGELAAAAQHQDAHHAFTVPSLSPE